MIFTQLNTKLKAMVRTPTGSEKHAAQSFGVQECDATDASCIFKSRASKHINIIIHLLFTIDH